MYNQVSYPKTVEAKERGFQALNKHFKLLGVLLLAMVLLAIPFAVQADAAEGQSVVYLMDGATGDGSSPESPRSFIIVSITPNEPPEMPARKRYTAIGHGQATPSVRPIEKSRTPSIIELRF